MPKMVTIQAAANQTGLTYSGLRRLILEGKFVYFVRVGTKYLVNLEMITALCRLPAAPAAPPV